MQYHVARNGQVYGPYTLEDLQRYVASGNVLLTDSARAEDSTDWVPVSQLLGAASASYPEPGAPPPAGSGPGIPPFGSVPPGYPAPAFGGGAALAATPGPPDLHWGLVLLFDLLTCSLFQLIWNLILANWFRRVYPPTRVLLLYAAAAVLIFAQGAFGQSAGFIANRHGINTHGRHVAGYALVATVCWIVRLVARFTFRAELEQHYNTVEPIGLEINPVLTFFFGGIYLQSVMNRINAVKRGVLFGGYPR